MIGFGQVYIPDANFKAYLVGNSAINTNGDSEIQVSEATAFNGAIFCSNMSISDLTGIESFIALGDKWSKKQINNALYHRGNMKRYLGLPFCADYRSSCEGPESLMKESACDDYKKWCE